jgi:HPt (histidine-containing phosphotransfer) domain-containing protein
MIASVWAPETSAQEDAHSYEAKAKFPSIAPGFVEWPTSALKNANSPLQICVHGDFSFGTNLAKLTSTATLNGHRMEVKWARKEQDLPACQILFVSRSATAHAISGDREKYLGSGMDGYVSKPIRTDLLREEITRVVQFAGMCARSSEVSAMKKEGAKSLDREELLNRVEHDEELLREILAIFQADSQASRKALSAAVAAHEADQVRSAAHAFKGMLANLSSNPASAAAAHLEELAKEGRTDELAGAWQAFEKELGGVLREVEDLLSGALK